ncbi:MAG: sulfurtransferase [Dehalococcoidia bacterium]|nr:sulfurtransferase [Dehalococcoidia bacterium]MCB9483126.1 sulfurtransferase [Dehalococcoidia bacterium]
MVDKLVTADWVQEHLNDGSIRLVEVDVDTEAYREGHIEGAVAWNWTTQLQDGVTRDILTKADFEQLMANSGITPDTHVVLYGDNNNWFAAYALWLMELYGHQNVSLMNGGRVKWLSDNRPTTTAEASPAQTSYTAKDPDPSIRAKRDDVLNAIGSAVNLVDVRSPAEFTGEVIAPPGMTETAQRGGHVPGAKNIPWARAVNEDGTFKSVDELKSLYEGAGVQPNGDTIAYCRIGERSSHTWFVLKHILGYDNVKNYDGSWTEYGSMVGVPIEK